MEGEILNAIKHVKNSSKKQATVARIYSITKKTRNYLIENVLEIVIDNIVDKTVIGYHQRSKSHTVPGFTDDTVLAEQTQDTDEDATQTPSHNNENLIEETQLQDVTDKDTTETCDITTNFKLFEEL